MTTTVTWRVEYDDDHPFVNDWVRSHYQSLGDASSVGDPCVWCDHSKCEACPPPRALLTVVGTHA